MGRAGKHHALPGIATLFSKFFKFHPLTVIRLLFRVAKVGPSQPRCRHAKGPAVGFSDCPRRDGDVPLIPAEAGGTRGRGPRAGGLRAS